MIRVNNKNTRNPFLNLAIEEYLVRHSKLKDEMLFFTYINSPCVVLGKNQSIYREVNFDYLRCEDCVVARRLTGGGAVYQDEGNLNFSFIASFDERKVNNYRFFNQPVVAALVDAGVPAEMDARNNIVVQQKKISGNSQFTDRKNILSHGTLLVCTDLEGLRGSLRENDFTVEAKAVASVRASVQNIGTMSALLQTAEEAQSYLQSCLPISDELNLSEEQWQAVEQLAQQKFCTFEWIYGRSPTTRIQKNGVELIVEEGKIKQLSLPQPDAAALLQGVPYAYSSIKKALEGYSDAQEILQQVF